MTPIKQRLMAVQARRDLLTAAYRAGKKGAHIAPSLSLVEICLSILGGMNLNWDCFVLSKGHGALGYYAAMHQSGMMSDEQFDSFEDNGGEFPGQPSKSPTNGICFSSGSLGMGLSYALGLALGKKKKQERGTVYVVIGDGELNEGSNWEAAALANRYALDNLTVVVDRNGLQSEGKCDDIVNQRLDAIWSAFGWQVRSCDGHSLNELGHAIAGEHKQKPLVVLAATTKGKGVSFMENNNEWHHAVLKKEDYENAIKEIGEGYDLL